MEALVEALGLRKVYPDGTVAVDGVSFKAGPGVTVLMGPNGSGKTTTLSMVAGALRPTSGRVVVCGYDMWGGEWSRPRECVGFAPQDMPFREKLTVMENLVWYGLIRGLSLGEARRRARRLLEEVGLEGAGKKKVAELSGGMRRRLSLAAALMGDPRVLVLDEPTSGLDPAGRMRLWGLIKRLAGERVVIASTHIPEEAEEHADTVLIFHRGRIAASGRPAELIKEYARHSRIVVEGRGLSKAGPPGYAELVEASDTRASFLAEEPEEVLPKLLADLLAAGASVERVEVRRPGLAEVYFAVTGEAELLGGGGAGG
ncbi:MAG: ABC transporter ATP-binding protein [Desulfurococcales archaeon]|nr:ABC transporter ATP-binding protein [Desulfurococcales archaeon]